MAESSARGGAVTARDWLVALVVASLWVAVVRPGPLDLAYFWDEADVYVPGSLWVAEHDLAVTPGVFPDDYSRGHPPLLFLLAGIAFRLFGPGPMVGHLVVLPFTVLALAATYALGASTFGRRAGLAAALLLGATPLFMSIGNMLLPEMPLTALAVLALVVFSRGRVLSAALLGGAAALIKETGVFVSVALAGAVLWDGWRRGVYGRLKPFVIRLLLASLPLAVLCGFFVWQRLSPAGYFIFPHHQNLLWERPFGVSDLLTVWPSLVLWHGRWVLVGAALLGFGLFSMTTRHDGVAREGDEPTSRWRPLSESVVASMLLLLGANAVFFAKMFWLERYALPAHPGLLVLACGVLLGGRARATIPRYWRELPWAVVVAAIVFGLSGLRAPTAPNEEEHTFAYADVIATHRLAYRELERMAEGGEGRPRVLSSWPMTVEMRYPYIGYVENALQTVHIDYESSADGADFDAVLVSSPSRHAESLRRRARELGMGTVRRFQVGVARPLELHVQ